MPNIKPEDVKRLGDFAEQSEFIHNRNELYHIWQVRDQNGVERSGAMVKRRKKLYVVVPVFMDWWLNGETASAA